MPKPKSRPALPRRTNSLQPGTEQRLLRGQSVLKPENRKVTAASAIGTDTPGLSSRLIPSSAFQKAIILGDKRWMRSSKADYEKLSLASLVIMRARTFSEGKRNNTAILAVSGDTTCGSEGFTNVIEPPRCPEEHNPSFVKILKAIHTLLAASSLPSDP